MPTADLTLHLGPGADRPPGPWVLGVVRSRVAADGYALEDGELWAPGRRAAGDEPAAAPRAHSPGFVTIR